MKKNLVNKIIVPQAEKKKNKLSLVTVCKISSYVQIHQSITNFRWCYENSSNLQATLRTVMGLLLKCK